MSFFSGGKKKEKEVGGKKAQFYVEFLGWMECRGVRGHKYTDPVIHELRRRQKKVDKPPKLTLQLSAKELKITQDFEEKRKRSIKKIQFPAIPARDVTYAVQALRPGDRTPDDIVACIYLGFMPRTQRWVHVHVYRFDEPSTAATFARMMNGIVETNHNRVNEVERDLAERGEIEDPRLTSSDGMSEHTTHTGTDSAAGSASGSAYSEEESPTFGSDDMEADLQSLCDVREFDNVASELKQRLKMGQDAPILLPPKDYDTISRAHGNLKDINRRRCLNINVVGEGAVQPPQPQPGETPRDRNGSEESGIDLASPVSEGGDVVQRFAAYQSQPGSGTNSPAVQSGGAGSQGVSENGFVYPPRQERVGGAAFPRPPGSMSPALKHVRQSSQSSGFSTHSSRHSDGNNSNEAFPPAYRRTNSNNNFEDVAPSPHYPPPQHQYPPHQPVYGGVGVGDGYFPPQDYDENSFGPDDVVLRRRPGFPTAAPVRPASGSGGGGSHPGSPLLMRSLPAKVLQSELALSSPRSPRRLEEGEEEYYFNGQRRSQPLYASQGGMDYRPLSADHRPLSDNYNGGPGRWAKPMPYR